MYFPIVNYDFPNINAMENHPFPSYNHPFYPDGEHQQSFIDYGSVSTLNIDISSEGRLVTSSRHQHYDSERRGRFVGAHLTLPLLSPCRSSIAGQVFPEQRARTKRFNRTNFKQSLVEQARDLCRDHPDVAFQSSIGFIDEELQCKPWDSKCFYYPKNLQTAYRADTYRRQCLNPNEALEKFCDLFVTFPLNKQIGVMKEGRHSLPNGLCEAMLDVSPKMLYELLSESIEQEKNERFFFDILQGNTLAYCNMGGHQLGHGVLFYPSGPTLEVLNASVVKLGNSTETRTFISRPDLMMSGQKTDVNGPIRQIYAMSYEYGDSFVATRSRYNCSFFKTTTTTATDNTEIIIKTVDSLDNENQPMSLALSPFLPGEGIVAMETGQVWIWHHGKKSETRDVPSVAPDVNRPWYQCIYASHPRCVMIANSVEADIMDLRASGSFSRNLFSITSKQVSTQERISAIQRHPRNTHHYIIATDQSLLIMDDRFIQHPVLKWRHHLQDPVQHIEAMINVVPDCEDTIIMVSGSQHHETHCFQYNKGEHEARHSFPFSGDSVMNPPVSAVLPWKVSSYDEWPSLVPASILPVSSVLDDRLANPLIGVCGIPLTFQEDRKGFLAIQMSSLGDIFYQPFIPDKIGRESHQDYSRTVESSRNFLTNWINELQAMEKENLEFNKWPLKSNMTETDCGDLFRKMVCLIEPHRSCVLCINDTNNSSASIQDKLDDNEVSVCPRCGIDVKYGRQLKNSQNLNSISSKEMRSGNQCEDLNLVPKAQSYQDPLSKNVFRNWLFDTPIPLNLGNSDETDNETEVPVTSSDLNLIAENKNEDDITEEAKVMEIVQSSNEILQQESNKPDERQTLDVSGEVSLELSSLASNRLSESHQSPLKSAIMSPVKQVKRTKRILNQSMGF